VPVPAYLPDSYVADSEERMDIYRRISRAETVEQIRTIRGELVDRFGPPPPPGENMLGLVETRERASVAGLENVEIDASGVIKASFFPERTPGRKLISEMAGIFEGRLTFGMEEGFTLTVDPEDGRSGLAGDLFSSLPGAADIESLLNLLEIFDK
jgi:transcription-repair coupling factor (superfamily II helicase)